jgi:hypothetical protein
MEARDWPMKSPSPWLPKRGDPRHTVYQLATGGSISLSSALYLRTIIVFCQAYNQHSRWIFQFKDDLRP